MEFRGGESRIVPSTRVPQMGKARSCELAVSDPKQRPSVSFEFLTKPPCIHTQGAACPEVVHWLQVSPIFM